MAWAPDYCTAAELRQFVRISDGADSSALDGAIAAASRAVDRFANRQFGVLSVAAARYYTGRYDSSRCRWVVDIDDLMTTTSLVVAVDDDADLTYGGTVTDYRTVPLNAAANARPWTQLVFNATSTVLPTSTVDEVKVTALWGWTAVPTAVKTATLLQASRFLARRDSPYGISGSPETGGELRLLARLDPDVEMALGPYRRWWGAV